MSSISPRISLLYRWNGWGHPMSGAVQEGCIASCVRYFLLQDRTHTFCLCSLLHVNHVRSRVRHIHVVHWLSYPLARLSFRLTVTLCGVVCNLLSHSLHCMILGENSEGKQKETLMDTYKAVMRPALEYATSIWSPLASSTSINKLQVMQNAALRNATGCIQDTNIQHLHDKRLILPLHEHLQLHASQYKQINTTSITPLTQTQITAHTTTTH